MTRKLGWLLAGVILVAMGSKAQAQVGIVVGNPYAGSGIAIGAPAYGYPAYPPVYGGVGYYSSGYAGIAPVGVYGRPYVAPVYGGIYRPYGYGYRPYYRRGYRRW